MPAKGKHCRYPWHVHDHGGSSHEVDHKGDDVRILLVSFDVPNDALKIVPEYNGKDTDSNDQEHG